MLMHEGDRPGDAATHWCHRRRGQRSGSAECMSRASVAKSTRHSSGDHPKQQVSIGVFLQPSVYFYGQIDARRLNFSCLQGHKRREPVYRNCQRYIPEILMPVIEYLDVYREGLYVYVVRSMHMLSVFRCYFFPVDAYAVFFLVNYMLFACFNLHMNVYVLTLIAILVSV
uniref:Uncharacterized protein n=1 Tax=Oryza nivara TaxID=4536 RepID=A0A0E0J479_ORYNI